MMDARIQHEPLQMTVRLQQQRKTMSRVVFEVARAVVVSSLFLLLMTRLTLYEAIPNLQSTVV